MTLFEPYSHTRIQELRREEIARGAELRDRLALESALTAGRFFPGEIARRIALRSAAKPKPAPTRPSGRPALDS